MAGLRKEVLGGHLFVRPLEDFGLESRKKGKGEDGDGAEQGAQDAETQVLDHE